jgi:hypothetical protein
MLHILEGDFVIMGLCDPTHRDIVALLSTEKRRLSGF